jgi:5-dehydro-2-deoxygluconokinase
MTLGYHGRLFILAFDHRGSLQRRLFGVAGEPDAAQTARIADAKHVVFEGMAVAAERGVDAEAVGVLVDEQFGGAIPRDAKARGMKLAMPVERSGQEVFDFEYGEDFGAHIEAHDPDLAKVLVRWNPEGDAQANAVQAERLRRLSDWLHERERKLLFELLVPATPGQLDAVGGDADRFDAELRPALTARAMEELQDAGVEPDVWKLEGMEARADDERLAQVARRGGRDGVACVLLGRGASTERVDHWLRQAAPVEGFVGFAIGRSIWLDTLAAHLAGDLGREEAAERVAAAYLRFVDVYASAERDAPAPA